MMRSTIWSSSTEQRCFACMKHRANKSSQTAYLCRGDRVRIRSPYPESRYVIQSLDMDLDDFQNVTMTSLFEVTFVVKFSWRSDHFVQRYNPNCGKMPYLATLKNPSKNSLIRIGSRRLPKSNQFFLVHWCICDKVFTKICLVVLCNVANRLTDKRQAFHNLLGRGDQWGVIVNLTSNQLALKINENLQLELKLVCRPK